MSARTKTIWTFAITSVALFMVTLDNLVVTMALPSIRLDLGASIEDLEWTVNAYTLSFAAFLLTASALGDRFGRRRMFVAGLLLFVAASAACALAPSIGWLIGARAVQGVGAAIVMPLALAQLSAAFPRTRVAGPGAPIAAAAPAVTERILVQVAATSSATMITSLCVPLGEAKKPLFTGATPAAAGNRPFPRISSQFLRAPPALRALREPRRRPR